MNQRTIMYNRRVVTAIIVTAFLISLLTGSIVIIAGVLGAIYFVVFYNSPVKADWISKPLTVFHINDDGIKLYPYEERILWKDIKTFSIDFDPFQYHFVLHLKLNENIRMTDENHNFYSRLSESRQLDKTNENWEIIYPFMFADREVIHIQNIIQEYLIKESTYHREYSKDRLEVNQSPLSFLIYIGAGFLALNIFLAHIITLSLSLLVAVIAGVGVYFCMKYRTYIIFDKDGFDFPSRSFKIKWIDLRLVEKVTAAKYTSGTLIVWLKDAKEYLKENLDYISHNEYITFDNEERLLQTGRLELSCGETSMGSDELRAMFIDYINKYGKGEKTQELSSELPAKENKISHYKVESFDALQKPTVVESTPNTVEERPEIISPQPELDIEVKQEIKPCKETKSKQIIETKSYDMSKALELQKLMNIAFKEQSDVHQMILVKEAKDYYVGIRVQDLQLDGYCIFSKEQISGVSYCDEFYNDLLHKEYFFKLNPVININFASWQSIFTEYTIKSHFIELKVGGDLYKGKIHGVEQDNLILMAFDIDSKGLSNEMNISYSDINSVCYDTVELNILKKYIS